jgi:RHS repeat-associated protein
VLATIHPNAIDPPTTTVAFEYDYAGRMMSRSLNGAKTWILYDRNMPLAEFADGANAVNAAFLYSPDRLDDFHAVWRAGIGTRLLLKDHIGTVLGATDQDGALVWWTSYDAFGNLRGTPPANAESIRFAGRFYNEALGLYEVRRRFFDPQLGRFTQEDPLGFAGGDMNLYRYGHNNPLSNSDPTGKLEAIEYAAIAADFVATFKTQVQNAGTTGAILEYVAVALAGGSSAFPDLGSLGGGIPWPLFIQAGIDAAALYEAK